MGQTLKQLIWPWSRQETEAVATPEADSEPVVEGEAAAAEIHKDPGKQALQDQDWQSAAVIWGKRALDDPKDARNHRHYIRCLIQLDRLYEAAAACDIARKHHRRDPEFLLRRLWLLDRLNIGDAFRKELRQPGVMEAVAGSGRMSLIAGRHFWRQGILGKARAHFLDAASDPETRSRAEIHLARLEYRAGDLDQAEDRWSRIVEDDGSPGQPAEPFLFLGRIALKRGDREEAESLFAKAEVLDPSTVARIQKWMPDRHPCEQLDQGTEPAPETGMEYDDPVLSPVETIDLIADKPFEDSTPVEAETIPESDHGEDPASPETADELVEAAQASLEEKNLESAKKLALNAMALDESNYKACEIAGFAANRSADWKVAAQAWSHLADLQPFRIGPLFQAASAHEQMADRAGALAFGERVLEIEPTNETALSLCARQLARSNDLEGLRSFSARIEALDLEELPDRLVMTLADGFAGLKCHDEAAIWVDRAIAKGTASQDIKLRKARLLYAAGDYEASADLWQQLLEAPESVVRRFEPHVFLARSAVRMGDAKAAIFHFRKVMELNPQHLESRDGLITALLRDGDLLAADQENERFRRDFKGASRPLILHLIIGYRTGDAAEIGRRYDTALAESGDDLDALVALGRALDGQQDNDRALAHWSMLSSKYPGNVDILHRLLMRQTSAGGIDRAARDTARALVEAAPENETGLLQLAILSQRLGDLEEAEKLYVRGMRRFPANIGFWIGHGNALMRADKIAEGQSLLAKARTIADESDPVALTDLARLAELTDLPDDAEALYDSAIRLSPANPQLWRRAVRFNMNRGAYGKAWDMAVRARELDRRDPIVIEALMQSSTALQMMRPDWHRNADTSYRGLYVPDDMFPIAAGRQWQRPMAKGTSDERRGAMLVTSTLGSGGAERQIMFSMQALARVDHGMDEIHLVARSLNSDHAHDFFLPLVEKAGFPVIELAGRTPVDFVRDLGSSIIPHREAVRIAASMPPEILSMALPLLGVFLKHRPEVVHTWQDTVNIAGGLAALLAGVPRIVLGTRSTRPDARRRMRRYLEPGYKALLELPNVTMVNNSHNGARDYEDWLGLEAGSVGVIHNGFDVDEIRAASTREPEDETPASLGIPDNAQVIGGVMRFSEEKRPGLFVDAAIALAPRLPGTHFLLIGEGPLRAELRKKVADAGLSDRIHLPGAKRPIEPWMNRMSILVLTSRMEGLPNVLIEAQILGVPVAATKVGGVPETMIEGETGIMVDSDDPSVLADHLFDMAADTAKLRDMGEAACDWAESNFSLEGMIRNTLGFYKLPDQPGS